MPLSISSTLLGSAFGVTSRRSCPLQLATVVRDTGGVSLVNNSDSIVLIPKNSQMADVVACYTMNLTKDIAQTVK